MSPTYDVERLRVEFAQLVEGRGELHWRLSATGASGLLVPTEGSMGTPILINVSRDEAVVRAGAGATLFLSCAEADDENHVVEVMRSIIDGGAKEFGTVDVDGRFRTDLSVTGPFGEISFPIENAIPVRDLLPWDQPEER